MRHLLTAPFLATAAAAAVVAGVLGAASTGLGATALAADMPVVGTASAGVPPTTEGRVGGGTDARTDHAATSPVVRVRTPAARELPRRGMLLAVPPLPTATSPEGWTVAGEGSRDPVPRGGREVRWTLEVQPSTGLSVVEVLTVAEEALYDERSWARDHELVRVDDPGSADVRVLLATPGTVDELCGRAGLVTNGRFSCWNGRIAVINLMRWMEATPEFDDLALYRRYVINHEVGHGLGEGHVGCAGEGRRADVMQQQTVALRGCLANEWPHPDGG